MKFFDHMSELAKTCKGQKISYQASQFFDHFENGHTPFYSLAVDTIFDIWCLNKQRADVLYNGKATTIDYEIRETIISYGVNWQHI